MGGVLAKTMRNGLWKCVCPPSCWEGILVGVISLPREKIDVLWKLRDLVHIWLHSQGLQKFCGPDGGRGPFIPPSPQCLATTPLIILEACVCIDEGGEGGTEPGAAAVHRVRVRSADHRAGTSSSGLPPCRALTACVTSQPTPLTSSTSHAVAVHRPWAIYTVAQACSCKALNLRMPFSGFSWGKQSTDTVMLPVFCTDNQNLQLAHH